jgi:hypothetical protein
MQQTEPNSLDASEAISLSRHLYNEGFQESKWSDVEVKTFGKTYKLHKLIISQNDYFRVYLEGRFKEREDVISLSFDDPNITDEAFEIALGTMYGFHNLCLRKDIAFNVLATSSFLSMHTLSEKCVQFIVRNLEYDNILEAIDQTERFEYGSFTQKIRNSCFIFLCRNAYDKLRSLLPKLPQRWFESLLSSDILWVPSEYERYELVRDAVLSMLGGKELIEHREFTHDRPDNEDMLNNFDRLFLVETVNRTYTFDGASNLDEDNSHYFDTAIFRKVLLFEVFTYDEIRSIQSDIEKFNLHNFFSPEFLSSAFWNHLSFRSKILNCDFERSNLLTCEASDCNVKSTTCISDEFNRDLFLNHRPQPGSSHSIFRCGIEFNTLTDIPIRTKVYSKAFFYGGYSLHC